MTECAFQRICREKPAIGLMVRIGHILGVLLWLLATAASGHAENSVAAFSFDPVQAKTHVASCQKLTMPQPMHKQCHGKGGQSSTAARSNSNEGDDKVVLSDTPYFLLARQSLLEIVILTVPTRPMARRARAPFWQTFSFSPRLRN